MENKKNVYISAHDYEFNREIKAVEKKLQELGMSVPNLAGKGGWATEMRVLYENLVRNSDIFIGIYGSSIGPMVPDPHTGLSTYVSYLESDYKMAEEEGIPVLAFVQDVKVRDDSLTELVYRIGTRKGAYRFLGRKDLIEAIEELLPKATKSIQKTDREIGIQDTVVKNLEKKGAQEEIIEDVTKPNPIVMISYSWEDEVHKQWVNELGTRLRSEGVNIILDQWSTKLGDQLPHFMEKSVRDSDFVIFICTQEYKDKADNRLGGVGYEGHIITSEIYENNNQGKFIPLLRKGDWKVSIPTWAKGKLGVDLCKDPYSEQEYDKLLQYLHGITPDPPPLGPEPGTNRFKINQTQALKGDIENKKETETAQILPSSFNYTFDDIGLVEAQEAILIMQQELSNIKEATGKSNSKVNNFVEKIRGGPEDGKFASLIAAELHSGNRWVKASLPRLGDSIDTIIGFVSGYIPDLNPKNERDMDELISFREMFSKLTDILKPSLESIENDANAGLKLRLSSEVIRAERERKTIQNEMKSTMRKFLLFSSDIIEKIDRKLNESIEE